MAIVTIAYTLLVILYTSLLQSAEAESASSYDMFNVIISLNSLIKAVEDLSKVVEKLETKIETQGALMNTLEATVGMHVTLLNNRMADPSLQAVQLLKMLELQATVLNKLEAQAQTQATLINNLVTKEESQATSLNNSLVANEGIQATSFKVLETNVQILTTQVAKLSADVQQTRSSKEFLEGIVAGTNGGVVVIPRGLREQKTISSKDARGVAFDWSTRKIYWIEAKVGIWRSNLDGTSMELLIADTLELWGLAVDQITGNFFYGIRHPKQELRVCGRSGKNCAVIAPLDDRIGDLFFDIALYPSDGIMFWSNSRSNKAVVRANMDGTDAKVIVSAGSRGISVDEASRTLYSASTDSGVVASYDLNGSNKEILLNATLSPMDVAVYGDTVYFGSWDDKSVYSVNEAGALSFIASTTGNVRHITLYGSNKVPSRHNPCENSPCPNVCVLNSSLSYTCL